ncbi:SdiA-regulated domain-containing protein [Lacibacter sp. H407]|uniref:SdiA-regulated domain-containing protein n=1 Tax=Lacibacter sp. H407 TaxID=3133423 RepID=UPI0030C20AC4
MIVSLFMIYSFLIFSCKEPEKKETGKKTENQTTSGTQDYNFKSPDATWELPSALKEISGMNLLNDSVMLCQEDENGKLYLYNLSSKEIDKTIPFSNPQDYEDLAVVGADVYLIQSNGNIVQVTGYLQTPVLKKYKTALSRKNDTEGICYDRVSNALLIACKEDQSISETSKQPKAIYTFKLDGHVLTEKPLLVFEEKDFKPSAIAVHPVTGNIFVLSASKRKLLEVNRQGDVLQRYELKGDLFQQPEGLTFSATADLYISNEGGAGNGNILLFKYKQ